MKQKGISSRPIISQKSTRTSQMQRLKTENERMSMTASLLIPTNKYPKCDHDKKHSKQIMNLICLTDNCKGKGPICVMCKLSDHSNHNVIPMKKFIEKVQECIALKQEKEQQQIVENSQILIEQSQVMVESVTQKAQEKEEETSKTSLIKLIQTKRDQMLYALSIHVQALAEEIKKLQGKIIEQTQKIIEDAQNLMESQKNVKFKLSQLNKNNEQPKAYRCLVNDILGYLNCKKKQKYEINCDILANFPSQITEMNENVINNIQSWYVQYHKLIHKAFEKNNTPKIDSKQKNTLPAAFKFSSELKIKSIEVSNEGKTAKMQDKIGGFVLGAACPIKDKTFKLKILNLNCSVMLGIGLKDIMKTNNYKFTSSTTSHGGMLITNNGLTYAHNNKQSNGVSKSFNFLPNDEISVSINGQNVSFQKKNENKIVNLPLNKMSEQEWKQLTLCVFLGGIGDKVQIVE